MAFVLITGGAGFVGRRFCQAFLERGDNVVCVDPIVPLTGGLHPTTWRRYCPFDSRAFKFDQRDCRQFFAQSDQTFDIVVHLAAMVGGREMIENQPLIVADDLSIDASYWQWAIRTRPKRTIYFSSSAAYPVALQTQQNYRLLKESDLKFEGAIGMPDMTYGWAKLTGEYLCRLAYQRHGLRSVVYRPFSGYGEDQDQTYPVPAIAARVMRHNDRAKSFEVWGSGQQMRDFIYIDDVVRAVLKTFEAIDNGSPLNLSSGVYTSFVQLAEIMLSAIGKPGVRVIGTANTPEGVFARAGDRKLQLEFGVSEVISLAHGVKMLFDNLVTERA